MAMQVESDSGLLQGQRNFLANNALLNDDQTVTRFQKGDLSSSSTPNLSQYYNLQTRAVSMGTSIQPRKLFCKLHRYLRGSTDSNLS